MGSEYMCDCNVDRNGRQHITNTMCFKTEPEEQLPMGLLIIKQTQATELSFLLYSSV